MREEFFVKKFSLPAMCEWGFYEEGKPFQGGGVNRVS
jgi:hypothetical protein